MLVIVTQLRTHQLAALFWMQHLEKNQFIHLLSPTCTYVVQPHPFCPPRHPFSHSPFFLLSTPPTHPQVLTNNPSIHSATCPSTLHPACRIHSSICIAIHSFICLSTSPHIHSLPPTHLYIWPYTLLNLSFHSSNYIPSLFIFKIQKW